MQIEAIDRNEHSIRILQFLYTEPNQNRLRTKEQNKFQFSRDIALFLSFFFLFSPNKRNKACKPFICL